MRSPRVAQGTVKEVTVFLVGTFATAVGKLDGSSLIIFKSF